MVKLALRALKNLLKERSDAASRFIPPLWLIRSAPWLLKTRRLMGNEAYKNMLTLAKGQPERKEAMRHTAWFLCHTGLQDQGIAMYRLLLNTYGPNEMPPENVYLPHLQFMMFATPEIQTNEKVYKEHTYWGNRAYKTTRVYTDYPNALTQDRRLKVAYTCHFVTNSTSAILLLPLLQAHNRDRIEVFMYSDEVNQKPDHPAYTTIEHWRDTHALDNDAFCELLRKDQIDILMELNGPLVGNRYHVIARHPVPIQMAWHNYACTTGVPGMDYTLVGEDIEIRHLQPYYSETIFQKRGGMHAMPVADYFPPVSPPPFEKNGYITFGSFGQAHKVNRAQMLTWCEVLKRVPGSKFYMKAQMLAEMPRSAWLHHFKDGGIDASRLILEGNSDYATLLRCYDRMDIALDSFPYNAGTTTVEALIQGVPVISQIADRYASQIARPNQETAGHPELLASSREGFIYKAVALANDKARLKQYRQTLREDFRRARRGDVPGFIRELEDGYRELWQRFLTKHSR